MFKIAPSVPTILAALALLLLLPLASNSFADEASHRKQIEEMLDHLQIEQKVVANIENIKKVYLNQIQKIQVPEAYKSIIDDHQKKAIEIISSSVSWEHQQKFYVNAYALSLDESAAEDINAFLKSKLGRQFLQSQEDVGAAVKDFTTTQMENLQQQLAQLNQDLQTRIKQQQAQQ